MQVDIMLPTQRPGFIPLTFEPVATFLIGGLADLGIAPVLVDHVPTGRNPSIIIAPHVLGTDEFSALPRDAVLYNFEQMGPRGTSIITPEMHDNFAFRTVWDYSKRNVIYWKSSGVRNVAWVPLGYHPLMETGVTTSPKPDVDIVFYGLLNERRLAVLKEVEARGVSVEVVQGHFGSALDEYLRSARMVINIHYYESGIMEVVRLSYLWANSIPVLTEFNPDEETFFGMERVAHSAALGDLARAATDLLDEKDLSAHSDYVRREFADRAAAAHIIREAIRSTPELSAKLSVFA